MNTHIVKAHKKGTKECISGYLWKGVDHAYIIPHNVGIDYDEKTSHITVYAVEIDPETICRWTGLCDKTIDRPIYEHDVVFVTDDNGYAGQIDTGLGEVEFLEGLWYICGQVQNSLYDINKCFQIEVIGNTIDNPELLTDKTEEKLEEEFYNFLLE